LSGEIFSLLFFTIFLYINKIEGLYAFPCESAFLNRPVPTYENATGRVKSTNASKWTVIFLALESAPYNRVGCVKVRLGHVLRLAVA